MNITKSCGLAALALSLLAGCGNQVTPTSSATTPPAATVAPTNTTAPTMAPTMAPTNTTAPTVAPTMAPTNTSAAQPTVAVDPNGPKVETPIKLFTFKPLEVKVGTTVTWTNMDAIDHSVTSGTPPTGDGAFDSGFFNQGKTYSFTFTKPGEYSYFCMRHNSMVGTVKVTQ